MLYAEYGVGGKISQQRNPSSVSGCNFWNVVEPYDEALKQNYKMALALHQSSARYNLKQEL